MKEHFAVLAAFVPALETGTFEPGEWAGGDTDADGVMTMPWFDHGDDMQAFVTACYALMMPGFSWPLWIQTDEAKRVRENISTASEDEIRQLITAMVRQERFVEGLLATAFENGTFLAIARRAAAFAS